MALYIGSQRVCPSTVKVTGHNEDKTITENGVYTAGEGYTGLGEVTVEVAPNTVPLDVTPTTSAQVIPVSGSATGYSPVNVSAVTSSIDSNITAGNIKKDVTILGVTGSYEPSIDSLTINPSTTSQTITAPTGTDGYSPITVNPVTSSIDSNIIAKNIREGVEILGVEGSYTGDGANRIVVVDYDGTILKEEYLDTGETFTLPNIPTHERLTFEQWVCPLTITDNAITVPDYDVYIGPTYTTKSGLNEFDIQIDQETGLTFTLKMDGTKNWGDGTSDTETSHTYSDYGYYTVTCDGTTFTSTASNTGFGASSSSYNKSVLEMRLNSNVTAPAYCFAYCDNLEAVSNTSAFTGGTANYTFGECHKLKCLILNKTSLYGDNKFHYNYSLKFFVSGALIFIPSYCFNMCTSLSGVNLAASCTLNPYALRCCSSIRKIRNANLASDFVLLGTGISTLDVTSTTVGLGAASNMQDLATVNFLENVTSFLRGFYRAVDPVSSSTVTSLTSAWGYSRPRVFNFLNNTDVPTLNNTSWYVYDLGGKNVQINVPYALYDEWIHASYWKDHAELIKTPNPATITFSFLPIGGRIAVNGHERKLDATRTLEYGGTTTPTYRVYNPTTATIASGTLSNVTEGSSTTVSQMPSGSNKITLNTGVADCSVSASIDPFNVQLLEGTGGSYSMKKR